MWFTCSAAQPCNRLLKCLFGGNRQIFYFTFFFFFLHPAKIRLNIEEKPQIRRDSCEAKMDFSMVRWRTKPYSTRARLIGGILQSKSMVEEGFSLKNSKQSQFIWQPTGITCSFLYKLFPSTVAQRCERFFCTETTLLEKLQAAFALIPAGRKIPWQGFKKKKSAKLSF